jgi:hypothetical protein
MDPVQPEATPEPLRVGVLLDSLVAPAWIHRLLSTILGSPYAAIVVAIVDGTSPRSQQQSLSRRLFQRRHDLLYNAYRKLDRRIFRTSPDACAPSDLTALLTSVTQLTVVPKRVNGEDWISAEDLARIKQFDLDVLIKLGFGQLRGEVLSAPRCGVWAYRHGDPTCFRGGPAGAWEVFQGTQTTGCVLEILNDGSDAGLVIDETHSSTDWVSVNRSLNGHYWKTLSFVPRKLAELHRVGADAFVAKARDTAPAINIYSERRYAPPSNIEMCGILLRLGARMLRRRIRKLFSPHDWQWCLLAQPTDNLNGSLDTFRLIAPPASAFWADPNVFEHQGRCYVFCEEFSYRASKGHIAVFDLRDGKWPDEPICVLDKPYHVSYPFVFTHNQEIFMLVECVTERRIEAYRAVRFPDRWEEHAILMDNVDAVDATLHRHHGRWWLFANMIENRGAELTDELFLFHAEDPFAGRWIPHPQNPVVSDVRRSRPAGRLFEHDGKLIRPSQDCAGGYGRGVAFNRVLKLSETEYEECQVGYVGSNWHWAVAGIHTFAKGTDWVVCDADLRQKRFAKR